jgi:hypothetical protein
MAIILKTNKVNLFVSSVLCVFWYHSPNVLDTLHICNISWLRVKRINLLKCCDIGSRMAHFGLPRFKTNGNLCPFIMQSLCVFERAAQTLSGLPRRCMCLYCGVFGLEPCYSSQRALCVPLERCAGMSQQRILFEFQFVFEWGNNGEKFHEAACVSEG